MPARSLLSTVPLAAICAIVEDNYSHRTDEVAMNRVVLAMLACISIVPAQGRAQLPPPNSSDEKAIVVRGSCSITSGGKTTILKGVTVAECMSKSGAWTADPAPSKQRDTAAAKPSTAEKKPPVK
jgi:hypothetical protein